MCTVISNIIDIIPVIILRFISFLSQYDKEDIHRSMLMIISTSLQLKGNENLQKYIFTAEYFFSLLKAVKPIMYYIYFNCTLVDSCL